MTSRIFIGLVAAAAMTAVSGCGSDDGAADSDADAGRIALSDLRYRVSDGWWTPPPVEMCGDALLVSWNPLAASSDLRFDEFAILDRSSGTGETVRVEAPEDSPWADIPPDATQGTTCVDTASGPVVQVTFTLDSSNEGSDPLRNLVAVFDLFGKQLWVRDDLGKLESSVSHGQRSYLLAATSFGTELEVIDMRTGKTVAETDDGVYLEPVGDDRVITTAADGAVELRTLAGNTVAELGGLSQTAEIAVLRSEWFALSTVPGGKLLAYDSRSGRRMWTVPIDLGTNVLSDESSDDEVLAVQDVDDVVHVIDVRTGEELWSKHVATELGTEPLVGGGMVRVTTSATDHEFAVFDARTGRQIDLGGRTLVEADAQNALIAQGEELSIVPLDQLTTT